MGSLDLGKEGPKMTAFRMGPEACAITAAVSIFAIAGIGFLAGRYL